MTIFALGDPHLSLAQPKPMDIFGPGWKDHHLKIAENWESVVGAGDWVLICGDTSWAMFLEEALVDLEFLAALPGKKILIKGNHDYWWKSVSKVRRVLPDSIYVLQNDFLPVGDVAVCGTRGWTLPNGVQQPEDEKIYARELLRARLSLEKASDAGYREKLFMLHFPPFCGGQLDAEFRELFSEFNVRLCVYGHLHGIDHRDAVQGWVEDTFYKFAAADFTGFAPIPVWPIE